VPIIDKKKKDPPVSKKEKRPGQEAEEKHKPGQQKACADEEDEAFAGFRGKRNPISGR